MERLFNNTLIVTGVEGSTYLWYEPDNKMMGINHEGVLITGTWRHSGTTICTIVLTPKQIPEQCGPLDYHNPGDAWSRTRPNGTISTATLIAGRHLKPRNSVSQQD
jgi:hypothetical protein